jgi:hypothetical protein
MSHIPAQLTQDRRRCALQVSGDEPNGVTAFNAGEDLFALRK